MKAINLRPYAVLAARMMSTTTPAHAPNSHPPKKLIFAPGEASSSQDSQPNRAAQFKSGSLHRSSLASSPLTQFHDWFSHPRLANTVPETCTLSTAHLPSGRVSARMVYLKELDEKGGFVVYSNWGTSQKARDFESNKWCSLVFWWKDVERQVRVEGKGERLTREESQRYFDTRARGSRLGAWASRQSQVLDPEIAEKDESGNDDDGRKQLDGWVKEQEEQWEGKETIQVPEFWGGLRVMPEMVEFWQGRESRLHDRFRYTRVEDGEGGGEEWMIERLSP